MFWKVHDPTALTRQGPDIGTQYRSVVFFHGSEQKAAAIVSKEKLQSSGRYGNPIVAEIVSATEFYPAEDDHQRYLDKRGWSR